MDVLTLEHVSKAFGRSTVLDDLSFRVPQNCVYGFIGENGAGKTTTMKLILGLLRPDKGQILVEGEPVCFGGGRTGRTDRSDRPSQTDQADPRNRADLRNQTDPLNQADPRNQADALNQANSRNQNDRVNRVNHINHTNRLIGYLPDVPEFYDFLTPREYLELCGRIAGMEKVRRRQRIEDLLKLVGLAGTDRRIHGFSRGMKQRLGIAQALLGEPKLLICDEPTSALDPSGRREILDILCDVRSQTTVLFSTHILSDVERICDRIGVLRDGKIALEGSLDEVRKLHRGRGLEVEFLREADALLFAEKHPEARRAGRQKVVFDRGNSETMGAVLAALSESGAAVQRVELREETLEELFMEVMRR